MNSELAPFTTSAGSEQLREAAFLAKSTGFIIKKSGAQLFIDR
jgi:hypothetical protein